MKTSQTLHEILTKSGLIETKISNFISESQTNSGLLKQLKDLRISEFNQLSKDLLLKYSLENDAEITKSIIMLGKISKEFSNIEKSIENFIIVQRNNQTFFPHPKKYLTLTVQLQGHLKAIREELNKLSPESLTENKQSPNEHKSPALGG